MASTEAGAAVLSSMQAIKEGIGGYNDVGDGSREQIDSSDEYDPAQDVQDISFPASQNHASSVESSNNASRPSSAVPQPRSPIQGFDSYTASDTTHQRSLHQDPIRSPKTIGISAVSADSLVPSTSSAPGVPKARLPHDTIGILEDRIKEDEKGDLDAWLSLINEYKRRNKLEDVRKVYDRFFAIFPQAVGILCFLTYILI